VCRDTHGDAGSSPSDFSAAWLGGENTVERVEKRGRESENGLEPIDWEQVLVQRGDPSPEVVEDEDGVDLDGFPVMVRLSQVQSQIAYLTQTVERLSQTVERVERGLVDGTIVRAGWRAADTPFPSGITARANPMTHQVTPLSARAERDSSRDDALASVRALFAQTRRPWWQRLPELLRG
jgi:hypothetical protein